MKTMRVDQVRVNVVNNAFVIRCVCPTVQDAINLKEAWVASSERRNASIVIKSDTGNVEIIPE